MSEASTVPAPSRLLRIAEVRARVSLGKTTIYRWIYEKRFPEPIRFSEACVRWRESDIDQWIESKSPPREPTGDAPH